MSLTDQSFLKTKSLGIFNVSLGLAKALIDHPGLHELHLLCNKEWNGVFPERPGKLFLHEMNRDVPSKWSRVYWDQIGLPMAIRKIKPDWALLPKGFLPVFSSGANTKMACYVHDVIWEYYQNLPVSEKTNTVNPFPANERLYFPFLGKYTLKHADLVLTSSQFNKNRFLHYAPHAAVSIVGIGFPPSHHMPNLVKKADDILLFVSPFTHKKSHQAIAWLSAWLSSRENPPNVHLIGQLPPGLEKKCSGAPWINHGRISSDQLDHIMTEQCRLGIYFSGYEGYGMPPVECWLKGVPCLSSDIPPIRENMPEPLLFSNDDQQSFEERLTQLYEHPEPFPAPQFPDWHDVADLCIEAMLNCK